MILMHIQKKNYIAIKNCIGSTAVEMLAIQLCVKNDRPSVSESVLRYAKRMTAEDSGNRYVRNGQATQGIADTPW